MSISDKSREILKNQLLDVAANEFMNHGFVAVSLDSIIKKTGGSKSKIYNYFGGKEGLFIECIRYKCNEILSPLKNLNINESDDLHKVLAQFGKAFLATILKEDAVHLLRLVISESVRFKDIGDIFINSGPKYAENYLAQYIERAQSSYTLQQSMVPERMAMQFIDMISRSFQLQLLIGNLSLVSEAEQAVVVDDAVALFSQGAGFKSD
ncbi:MAG: hypothetical protein CENE_01886 [Candidatus Celerinatantimonas neptuna]|nr:MAG: hypothetical protein CENE_01886 [Candidatus Celerinatantimonas neptuna]